MDKMKWVEQWLDEEKAAHIKGWDFSHIQDRFAAEIDLPWDYQALVYRYLKPEQYILDIDTGGGEFLLSLQHPYDKTSATEAFPPNVRLCKDVLLPLGIDFREADGNGKYPFKNEQFDLVINRHGAYNPTEIARVLKSDGIFITEQVGAENDRDLAALLLPTLPAPPFPEQYLDIAAGKFKENGFSIVDGQEAFRPIRFWDVGALVWFAHVIEWEFPNFTVESCLPNLFTAQKILREKGVIEGRTHRFLLIAKKDGLVQRR